MRHEGSATGPSGCSCKLHRRIELWLHCLTRHDHPKAGAHGSLLQRALGIRCRSPKRFRVLPTFQNSSHAAYRVLLVLIPSSFRPRDGLPNSLTTTPMLANICIYALHTMTTSMKGPHICRKHAPSRLCSGINKSLQPVVLVGLSIVVAVQHRIEVQFAVTPLSLGIFVPFSISSISSLPLPTFRRPPNAPPVLSFTRGFSRRRRRRRISGAQDDRISVVLVVVAVESSRPLLIFWGCGGDIRHFQRGALERSCQGPRRRKALAERVVVFRGLTEQKAKSDGKGREKQSRGVGMRVPRVLICPIPRKAPILGKHFPPHIFDP